jgi:catechol 2,3-dioxygenase-like lactoylglutathione lyase family enzyme
MKISRIESMVYGVEDLEAGIRYFEDWGVPLARRGKNGADFRLPSGQTIVLRPASDPALPPTAESGSTLRELVWGVEDASSLKAIAKELSRDREVKADKDGTLHARDECGYAIAFRQTRPAKKTAKKVPPRMNRPFDPERRARPQRAGHVVYKTRLTDLAAASRFYQDRLGFRLSDATPGGDFLRCPRTNDHHSLFLLARPDRREFDHIAFEVGGFDEIVLGGRFMQQRGWSADSPVGRHVLGSNLFWYFNNPCGGRTEYFADMDQLNDKWKPRVWTTHPGFALWTLDKTMTPDIPVTVRPR